MYWIVFKKYKQASSKFYENTKHYIPSTNF